MKRLFTVVTAALLIGGLMATSSAETRPSPTSDANGVIAFIDSGINPYHDVFADDSPRAQRHPSTYIPGYPKDAKALRLTLNEPDYKTAIFSDCERVWAKVQPGTLYWFPGTRIIGAISFSKAQPMDCGLLRGGLIRDEDGHGTMVASRAASKDYGACPQCLIVSVQFPTSIDPTAPSDSNEPAIKAIGWSAKNSDWIDAQSNSWNTFVPAWEPTGGAGLLTANPELVRAIEDASSKQPAFWGSGNGVGGRLGLLGHPTVLAPGFTPSAILVGGHDSGYVNTWPGFSPHVVADSCAAWGAEVSHTSKSGDSVSSGTSSATPFAAGGAVRILQEARRILDDEGTGQTGNLVASGPKRTVNDGPLADGKLTVQEWKEVTFKTATARPEGQKTDGPVCDPATWANYTSTPLKWSQVPQGYPEYLHIGYGAIDDKSLSLARAVLQGKKPLPDRAATDEYFARDRQVRETTFGVWSDP